MLIKTKTNYQWDKAQPIPGEEGRGKEGGLDNIIRQLQIFTKNVRDDIFQLNPTLFSTLPTAEKDKRGSFVVKEESSVTDKLNICLRKADGTFEFRQISPVVAAATPTLIEDADQNTKVQVEESADENIIRMDTAGTERWIMTAAGERTMPTQPSFQSKATSQTNFATGGYTVTFTTTIFDQSSDFATQTFTAPVTGKYLLMVNLVMTAMDTAANFYQLELTTSNRTYKYQFDTDVLASDPGAWAIGLSVVADMDANDTATVVINQSGGTQQTDISDESIFSGALLN